MKRSFNNIINPMPVNITREEQEESGTNSDERLKTLTEEKNNLLRIIAHDIRGPFNQMFALLQLMEMDAGITPESRVEYMNKMYQAVLGGMEMIKNLNDVRGIENRTLTVQLQKFSLDGILRQCIRNFAIHERIKKISMEYSHPHPDLEIHSDRIFFLKALDAILSNAFKFSETGTKVRLCGREENGYGVVEVLDQGPGIPVEELPMAFNKFQKLSPRPTMSEAATGSGLFIAREFMNMMNGEIKLENLKGGGLRATLKIRK